MRRSVLSLICILWLLSCESANGQWFRGFGRSYRAPANAIPVAFNRPPSQQQYLTWMLQHMSRVKQVDAKIQVSMTGTPKLRGSIQIERPQRLRLKAGILGMNEIGVDVGSNDDLFWIWTRVALPGQPPTLMYATHEGFKHSTGAVRQAVPLEPEWLIEALGLVDFERYDAHSEPQPHSGGRMKMISARTDSTGKQYRVTIFDAQRGIIEQQSLYSQQGALIAYTNSSEHTFYPEHNISLPKRIELHLFQGGQEVKLVVTTDNYKINSLFGDPNLMFRMPDPDNVEKINLAPNSFPPRSTPSSNTGFAGRPAQRGSFQRVTATEFNDSDRTAAPTGLGNTGRQFSRVQPWQVSPNVPATSPNFSRANFSDRPQSAPLRSLRTP